MQERKNIWLGLLGLAFTLIGWLILVVFTAAATYAEIATPGSTDAISEESPIAIVAGLALIIAVLLSLIGFVLAVVGLFSPTEKRLFPIVTVVLSAGLGILIAALVVIGVYFG